MSMWEDVKWFVGSVWNDPMAFIEFVKQEPAMWLIIAFCSIIAFLTLSPQKYNGPFG